MLKSIIDLLHANVVLVGLLVGAVTPLLTSVIQQPSWSRQARIVVSLVVSAVVGFVIAASSGSLDPGNLIGIVAAVYSAAEAFYQKVWSPAGVTGALEQATSRRGVTGPIDSDHPYNTGLDPYGDVPEYPEYPGPLETK